MYVQLLEVVVVVVADVEIAVAVLAAVKAMTAAGEGTESTMEVAVLAVFPIYI